MMIDDKRLEWATVDRFRTMLLEQHREFDVTHTFALFSSILCWVLQRVRVRETSLDPAAAGVMIGLAAEPIERAPWSIWASGPHPIGLRSVGHPGPFYEFEGWKADRFLIALRNAVAHGDSRTIKPFNRGGLLIGHEFRCHEKSGRIVSWEGKIVLDGSDMQRIGTALADRFCDAFGADVKADARCIRERAR